MAELTRHRGWHEDFVRWELPPWRGHSYLHADLDREIMLGHYPPGTEVIWADRESDPAVQAFEATRAKYCKD